MHHNQIWKAIPDKFKLLELQNMFMKSRDIQHIHNIAAEIQTKRKLHWTHSKMIRDAHLKRGILDMYKN